MTAPHEWVILFGLFAAILVLVLRGSFGQVERSVSTDCLVIYPGETHTIIAESTGNVAEVFVEVGEMVEQVQPLARLRSSELDRYVRLARAKVAHLEERAESDDSIQLELARNELLDLDNLQSAGQLVISNAPGELMSHRLFVGRVLQPGDNMANVRFDNPGQIRVVTTVSLDGAQLLTTGMDARIYVGVDTRNGVNVFEAVVLSISDASVDSTQWLSLLGLEMLADARLVELSFVEMQSGLVIDGPPCSPRIVYVPGSLFSVVIT